MTRSERYKLNWPTKWMNYEGHVKVTMPDGNIYFGIYYGEYSLLNEEGSEICHDTYCPTCNPPADYPPDMDRTWLNIYLDDGGEIWAQPNDVEPISPHEKRK